MTIATATSRVSYVGDGSTIAFAIPFFFQTTGDIVVFLQDLNGVTTLQALSTNYTLTGANTPAGGTATFVVAPPLGYLVSIYRDPPLTQTTSYNNNDPFPAKSHEAALDKACTIDQRTRDLALRSLHLPDAESSSTVTTLGSIATRKNRLLGFDSNGSVVYVVGPTFVSSTGVGVADVDSRATAQVTTFALSVNVIQTHGGNTFGDGGGLDYIRGTSGSPTPFQDGSGVFWTPATVQSGVPYANITGIPTLIAAPNSIWSTGDVKLTLKTTPDPLWLIFDDGTFGNAGSGASNRANVDTLALFTLLYNNLTDADAPLLTSAGGATTRGAQGTAATAFATPNFCRMTLNKTLGRALGIAGPGSGLTARALGHVVGTETFALSTTNLPAIPYTPAGTNASISVTSTVSNVLQGSSLIGGIASASGSAIAPTASVLSTAITSTGAAPGFTGTVAALGVSATPVSTMQPTAFLNAMIKL